MANEGNEFDNEMNSVFGMETPATGTPPAPKADNSPVETFKAAGREWKQSDFPTVLKHYDALHREMGTRNKDWAELKPLREVRENLQKDPEFSKFFQEKIREYQERKASGQSNQAAAKGAGLPPEVVQKLEKVDRFEKLADRMEYDSEVTEVTRKYKLSDEDMRKVEQYSIDHNGLELEASYKQMMFDLHQSKLLADREAKAAERKQVSKTSGPTPDHAIPTPKGLSLKGDADWRKSAGGFIDKVFGNNE